MKPKGTLKSDKLPSPPIVDWMLKNIEASIGAPGALTTLTPPKRTPSTPIAEYLDKRLGRSWESKPRKKKRAVLPYRSDGTATPLPETEEVVL